MISKEELQRFLEEQEQEARKIVDLNAGVARRIRSIWPQQAASNRSVTTRHQGRLEMIKNIREYFGMVTEETKR